MLVHLGMHKQAPLNPLRAQPSLLISLDDGNTNWLNTKILFLLRFDNYIGLESQSRLMYK